MLRDDSVEMLMNEFMDELEGKKQKIFQILKMYADYKALEEAHQFGNFLDAHLHGAAQDAGLTRFFEANAARHISCGKALTLILKKEMAKT